MIQLPIPTHQKQYGPPPNNIRVIFVGDKPSKANTDPTVAFEGTKSWITFQKWADLLGLSPSEYEKVNRGSFCDIMLDLYPNAKVIALGVEASNYLNSRDKAHFKLPHPSGLNRVLNDKEYIAHVIGECKRYTDGNR